MTFISRARLTEQLRAIGVERGMTLVVHTSFSRVGLVEGGPEGLIVALTDALGPSGTLVMPTITGSRRSEPYDPARTPSRNMGIVADTFWRLPRVLRGDHPTSSFAARGPLAAEIAAPQPLMPGHGPDSPIGRVRALGGSVLLLGVGHDANTTIHLAEYLAGVPYRVSKWTTTLVDGIAARVEYREIDHCCQNFELVGAWLDERGLQGHGTVGHATARLAKASDIVDVVLPMLMEDPLRFLCSADIACADCGAARASLTARESA